MATPKENITGTGSSAEKATTNIRKQQAGSKKRPAPPKAKKQSSAPDTKVLAHPEFITEYDIYLFREGKHFSLHNKLGAHVTEHENKKGT